MYPKKRHQCLKSAKIGTHSQHVLRFQLFSPKAPYIPKPPNASIERPTARIKSSHKLILITVFPLFYYKNIRARAIKTHPKSRRDAFRISLVISCIAVSFLKCVDHTALRADYSIAVPLCGTVALFA